MRTTVLALLLLPATALAVPGTMSHQGRLLDSAGVPLDGSHSVEFEIFDAASGGTSMWSETQTIEFDRGYYNVVLGSVAAMDADAFTGDSRHLSLTVDGGAPLPTRASLNTVPWAFHAATAATATAMAPGGSIDTTSVSVGGVEIIGSDGMIDYSVIENAPASLGSLGCSTAGEIASWDGSAWVCGDANAHLHAAEDITSGILSHERLPIGTGADTVAEGNHAHNDAQGDFTITGGVAVGDAGSDTCDDSTRGLIRYAGDELMVCVSTGWRTIADDTPDGGTAASAGQSCASLLAENPSFLNDDGVYWIDPAGSGSPFEAYCDMTTDGGGWTLISTISGADADSWTEQTGVWADASTIGDTSDPFVDFKGEAWTQYPLTGATQVLHQRRYDDVMRANVRMSSACLHNKNTFDELFTTFDTSLRCGRGQLTIVGPVDGTGTNYPEGTDNGLDGVDTNGWCWNGGDNNSNTFRGHAGWNQDVYGCLDTGHLGYMGVWQGGSQSSVEDISNTNWMASIDRTLVAVSFYLR